MPEEDEGPHVTGKATCAMHNVANLQESSEDGPSLDDLMSWLNVDHIWAGKKSLGTPSNAWEWHV